MRSRMSVVSALAAAAMVVTSAVAMAASTLPGPLTARIQMEQSTTDTRPLLFIGERGASVIAPAAAVWAYPTDSNAFFTDELWLVTPGAAQYIGTNKQVAYAGPDAYHFGAPTLLTGLHSGGEAILAIRADVGRHADGSFSGRALFDPAHPDVALAPVVGVRQQTGGNYVFFTGDPSRNIDSQAHGKIQSSVQLTIGASAGRATFIGFEDIYLPTPPNPGEPVPDFNDTGLLTVGAVALAPSAQRNCTLTIGYWKNHPTALDQLASLLPVPLGGLTVSTSAQAVPLLKYSGDASNGLNKLAGQLIAAELGIARGADASAIVTSVNESNAVLAAHPQSTWTSLSSADKAMVLGLVSKLDSYNNGLIGPGHCL